MNIHDESNYDDFIQELKHKSVVELTKYWIVVDSEIDQNTVHTIYPLTYCERWGEISAKERSNLFQILDKHDDWCIYRAAKADRTKSIFCLNFVANYSRIILAKPI